MTLSTHSLAAFLRRHVVLLCFLATAFTAIVPFVRSFLHVEVSYNEGWNLYNADRVLHHQYLYPEKFGWTTVNYPVLSFYIGAWLHRLTHDFLFTERALSLISLIAIGLLAGAILRTIGSSRRAAIIGGLFTIAVFCAAADFYVGVDDPQLLANAVFLLGFLLYLRSRRSMSGLLIAASVFVVAGCIKQSPVDFALAALLDLAFISLPLALWFACCLTALAALAVLANVHFGGPYFLAEFFAPRTWTTLHVLESWRDMFAVIPILFLFALYAAWQFRHHPQRRTVSILFAVSLCVGSYFSGGHGVSINGLFSPLIAMCLVLGLACDPGALPRLRWLTPQLIGLLPLALFAWLIIPLVLSGNIDPARSIGRLRQSQARFRQDVALLASRPGPALCESLLECYSAGKPYVYDPFNATRLIQFGKLDKDVLVRQLQQKDFAFVQLDRLTDGHAYGERFDPAVFRAIAGSYAPVLTHPEVEGTDQETTIYAPSPATPAASSQPH